MNQKNLFRAFDSVDDDILERSEAAVRIPREKQSWRKWGALAACFCLILTAALVMLPGILKGSGNIVQPAEPDVLGHGVNHHDDQSGGNLSQPAEPSHIQSKDTRAETWLTVGELGITKPEDAINAGLCVPTFISYQGGFYGSVGMERMDSLRFAPSESKSVLFNTHYTRNVYLVENHPDWIAIHINGMEVYERIFDVTFEIDGAAYAIAYSPVMNADYSLGNVVLETEDYTVYEAVKLQGEPAQTKEYIVDILPMLQRERPNLFDGSDLETNGGYTEQWQLALPLERSERYQR